MISYEDKLLFLSFQKILTTYLNFVKEELLKESTSLAKCKDNIAPTLSTLDYEYVFRMFDDMLYQNKQFEKLINNIYSEILHYFSSVDLSLSPAFNTSIDDIVIKHIQKIESQIRSS